MSYKICLFDLDGTLTDPKLGITKSVRYALNSFGIDVPDLGDLIKFIGPPLWESFEGFYGFSHADADLAVAKYREYFKDTGIYENALYPGVPEMLETLKNSGKVVTLATSKPTVFAARILEYFKIDACFSCVVGSELSGERSRKSEVIRCVLDNFPHIPSREAVMIGDREHDITGAGEVGIDSIGVTYGYGSREELTAAGATALTDTIGELAGLILRGDV